MSKINVVCLKWGSKFSSEYVNKLFSGVSRFLKIPHRFVCLTDDAAGILPQIETLPLTGNLKGWWNKLLLFKAQVFDLEGTILFFDLDLVIVQNIDSLVTFPGDFVALPEPTWKGEFGTAILRFRVGNHTQIWEQFEKRRRAVIRHTWGDQNWIMALSLPPKPGQGHHTRLNQNRYPALVPKTPKILGFPEKWFQSYKLDLSQTFPAWDKDLSVQESRLSKNTKVLVFHGEPLPEKIEWVKKYWK